MIIFEELEWIHCEGPEATDSEGSDTDESPKSEVQSNEVSKLLKSENGYLVFSNLDDFSERYLIMGKFDQGTFGQILHCYDRESDRHVAIKVSRGFQVFRDSMKKEITVLKLLADMNTETSCFIKMLDSFDYGEHLCIVLESISVSLFEYMKKNGFSPFPIDQVQEFGAQILESVASMHEIGLIHTGLKSQNVVLTHWESKRYSATRDKRFLPAKCDIRLIDFGDTVSARHSHFHLVSERNYRAPEVILGLRWTYPCDIWSIGSLLVELSTGSLMFETDNDLEHLAMMERVLGPLPENMVKKKARRIPDEYFSQGRVNLQTVSPESLESLCPLEELVSKHVASPRSSSFVDLLKGLLKHDPEERLAPRAALAHPFFQNPTRVASE